VVSGVDLGVSVESSDISELISNSDHEVTDTLPGGWGNVDSSANVSLVALEVESRDLDSEEGWDSNTLLEESVKDSDVSGGNSLEFSVEGSSSHTGKDSSEGCGINCSDVGGGEVTENDSAWGRDLTDSLDSV